jgi:hypothetical protein
MSYQDQLARYIELRRSGMSGEQAQYEAFGEGGIAGAQEAQQRRQGKQQQYAGYGQLAGTAGGLYLANKGYPKLAEALGFGDKTSELTQGVAQPELLGGPDILAGGQTTQAPVEMTSVKQIITPIQDPNVPEGFTKIDVSTQADGTVGQAIVPTESLQEPGFLESIDYGKVLQGAAGAAQLASAYRAYQKGDYAGAGIMGTGGAANLASSGALGTGAQTAAGEALGGYLVPGAQIAAGLYGAKQTADATGAMYAGTKRDIASTLGGGLSGLSIGLGSAAAAAAAGAAMGSVVPVVGTIIGAAAGYLGSRMFGSSKGKEQQRRDAVRSALQERGVLNDNWQGTLADGSTTDFGKDGSVLKKGAMEKIAEANPAAYEPTVQLSDALVSAYGFLGDNNRSLGRMFVRGALSNAGDDPAKAAANMQHFAQQQGITFDLIRENLDEGLAQGRIEQPEYGRLLTAAQQLVPPEPVEAPVVQEVRPEAGEVARLSPGMYRTARGTLQRAPDVRTALRRAYDRTKQRDQGERKNG